MRLLILGGTKFLGRHLVEAALARGHDVTLFNRGQTNPDLFPDLERLTGDRDGDLGALEGRTWDAVVDTCGYVPRVVAASARLLADAVEHYTFISSGSAYPHPVPPGVDEDGEVATMPDETVEEITGETYGPLKVLCERAVESAFPGRALNVRAGLIVGPHDPTDRFTYWPVRVARGGEVLAPVRPDLPAQFIDVRDLSEWIVRMAEQRVGGVFNATGPDRPLTLGELLDTCRDVSGSDATIRWAPAALLEEHGVEVWMGLPLWVNEEDVGFVQVCVDKAVAAGLTFRPLAETVRATLEWAQARPDGPLAAGIGPDKEAEVLAAAR